jgi:hypothetical protein
MTCPAVPLKSQPFVDLKNRIPEALSDVYDIGAIGIKLENGYKNATPASNPKHVFDTEDGYRFGIWVDRLGKDKIALHASLGFAYKVTDEEFSNEVADAFKVLIKLIEAKRKPDWGGTRGAGIVHFMWYLTDQEKDNGNLLL